ncbi:MAG TPA: type II toxin-antitoxin system HipA family toxin [Candidatus Kapabacteria bacterium]|nr:type II toxin-antitoxin system HipA family toxin [Candidatus Kapabacteria bacterium]
MSRILDVWYLNSKAGELTQDKSGRLLFAYDADYLTSAQAWPISISMPLRPEEFGDRITRPYFSGLLPDEDARKRMARLLRVSERNPFSLLEIVGGECAGALSLYPEGMGRHEENAEDAYFPDDQEMDDLFGELRQRPLLAGDKGVRLSLAGAHDKLAVRVVDGKLALMFGGAPTTHILKTLIGREDVQDSVHNELFCMMLAARCGLDVPRVEIRHTATEPFLLIERYDRRWKDGHVTRLHQEDFCQALSIAPENKYRSEGGPGIAACLDIIQQQSIAPLPDRVSFLNIVIFNYLIGNADAHGKNFSFLYEQGKPRLAPVYDLLSTAVYPELASKMSMKIGGKYEPMEVRLRHWHRLVPDTATARNNLEKVLSEMSLTVLGEAEDLKADLRKAGTESPVFDDVIAIIKQRKARVLS